MPSITPRTLIYDAYRSLGVLRPGHHASDDAVDDGFRALQDLVDAWQIEHLMVYAVARTAYPLMAGLGTYTLGPGGTLGQTRPINTESAGLIGAAGVESPINLLTLDQWRNQQSGVFIDSAFPAANVSVSPVPAGGEQLVLYTWAPLTRFALLDTAYACPEGYSRALRWNLALELAPYASISKKIPDVLYAHVERNAIDSKAAIKSFHSSLPPEMNTASELGCGCGYNVYTDASNP
jgi:hypothetical protein